MRSEIPLLAAVAAMAALTSCGASDGGGAGGGPDGKAAGSCAYTVQYDGTDYLGTGRYIGTSGADLIVANELGSAKHLDCAEGDQNFHGSDAKAFRIRGIDPQWAVAYGDNHDHAMIVIANGHLPDRVREKLETHAGADSK